MNINHEYSDVFYNYIEKGSLASAEVLLPYVLNQINCQSVVDLGCGRGAWLSVFKKLGIKKIWGLDGEYVDQNSLLIEKKEFTPFNLGDCIDTSNRFDLAMSLEVAEHLPAENAEIFVDNLVKLSDVILFSAAVVGQGGEHHINEKPLEYWKDKFESRGYSCYDYFRGVINKEKGVMPWYKYNTLLYANTQGQDKLSNNVLDTFVPKGHKVENYGSLIWKFRLFTIKYLPHRIATILAQANSFWIFTKTRLSRK